MTHNRYIMLKHLEIFAKRLRDLRIGRNLFQGDVAVDLNISRQTISKYELGDRQPDFDMLIIIADYYDVSIDYLLGRISEKQFLRQ